MVVSRELMASHRWSNHLVEDAEFQNELLLRDIVVSYVPAAKLWAEMPDRLDDSVTQNERWELGRMQVARRYVPELARRVALRRTTRPAAHVDAIIDHLVPPFSVLVAAQVAALASTHTVALFHPSVANRRLRFASVVSASILAGHVLSALVMIRAPRSVYVSLLNTPRAVVWKLRLWARMTTAPEIAWERTTRNAESS